MADPSIPQLILFVVLVTAAAGVTLSVVDGSDRLGQSVQQRGDTLDSTVRADVTVLSSERDSPYDSTDDSVTLVVRNTGDRPLPATADAVDLLLDGALVGDETVTVVDGGEWTPGAVARISVARTLDPGVHRAKVSVDGATDTVQFRTGLDPSASFVYDRPVVTRSPTTFDASVSFDPDGAITGYDWDPDGDGATDATGAQVDYTYGEPGRYDATLTVTDNEGASGSVTRPVRVYDADWPGYAYGPSNTGHQAVTDGPTENVSRAWALDLANVSVRRSSAAVRNESLYVGLENGTLLAVDRTDGSVRWRTALSADPLRSSPTVYDGTVYVGGEGGSVYAVDAADGSVAWSEPTGGNVTSSPVAFDGTVYVGSANDSLHAFDAAEGTERWVFATDGDVDSSPAVVGDTVYVGSRDGSVSAVWTANGSERWSTAVGAVGTSGPAVENGTVYVGVPGADEVAALNASNGSVAWTAPIGADVAGSPAVANGRVFVGGSDGVVRALSAANGSELWRDDLGGSIRSSPAVAGGAVFVSTGTDGSGTLAAYDAADGTTYWSASLSEDVSSSPVVVDDVVYLARAGGSGAELIAFAGDSPETHLRTPTADRTRVTRPTVRN